ncbi:MAG: HAMP domain-containing sensor histidine kinase [Clostridia bacterium]
MKLDTRSIRFRMWLYFSLFAIFTMALLWLFQVVFLRTYYEARRVRDIRTASERIISSYEKTDLMEMIDQTAYEHNVSVTVIDLNNVIIYSVNMLGPGSPFGYFQDAHQPGFRSLVAYSRFIPEIRDKGEILTRLRNPLLGNDTLLYGKVIRDAEGKTTGILFLNASIDLVDSTISTLKEQLIIVTAGVILISMLLSLLISSRISKPIIQITRESRKLGREDFNTVFENSRYTEINELAKTLSFASGGLSKVDTLRKEILSNISHDLRTPLTMIKGYAEMVKDISGENPAKREEDLNVIIEEANRLNNLVNDMLSLSKMQSGTEHLDKEVFCITWKIQEIMARYKIFTETEGFRFSFAYEEDAWVDADPSKITQVLYNLLNNAINHSDREKEVALRQTVHDNRVRIEVVDKGRGIPEENIQKIWDRYYTRGEHADKGALGSGLGLSIVKSILELHEARFGVDSKVGEGSAFWFELVFMNPSSKLHSEGLE